jgi:hypothetical protein
LFHRMSRDGRALGAVVVSLSALGCFAPESQAGFVYFNTERVVEAYVNDAPVGGTWAAGDSRTVTHTNGFVGDVSAGSAARATQTSSFGADGFTAVGRIEALGGANQSGARVGIKLSFEVDTPTEIDMHVYTQYDAINPDPLFGSRGFAELNFDGVPLWFNFDLQRGYLIDTGDPDLSPNGYFDVGFGTAINPGIRHHATFWFSADSVGGHDEIANYQFRMGAPGLDFDRDVVDFDFGAGEANGNAPVAVPLPPAAWAGVGTFVMMGLGRFLRRRPAGA